jgi:hypothetical protein
MATSEIINWPKNNITPEAKISHNLVTLAQMYKEEAEIRK